jgi:hypothetical protein
MLHYSKFVNTKALQRAATRMAPPCLPAFTGSAANSKFCRNDEKDIIPAAPIDNAALAADPVPARPAPEISDARVFEKKKVTQLPIHPSVNFEELQQKEQLNTSEQEWLSFFLGASAGMESIVGGRQVLVPAIKSPAGEAERTELSKSVLCLPVSSPDGAAQPPVRKSPACLDDIFKELISENRVFQKTCE